MDLAYESQSLLEGSLTSRLAREGKDRDNSATACWGYLYSQEFKFVSAHPNEYYDLTKEYASKKAKAPELFGTFFRSLLTIAESAKGEKASSFALLFVPTSTDAETRTGCCVQLWNYLDASAAEIADILVNLQSLIRVWGAPLEKYLFAKEWTSTLSLANTQSAIAAIMARNGSHNIGSHVLSALSHNVGTMPDDRVLYQYIQHRMDYIASATTGAPDWSVPTPFVGNLMKMFYSQRHLLDHIAESDGLHAYQYQGKGTQIGPGQNNCVKIVIRKIKRYADDETPADNPPKGWSRIQVKDGVNKRILDVYELFKPQEAVVWANDEALSIPGGILGQHAFYNIVENILRNAAKHSWAGKGQENRDETKNLEIFVDFEKERNGETVCFTVGDNMSQLFQDKFWEELFSVFNGSPDSFWNVLKDDERKQFAGKSLASVFAQPLDGFAVLPEANSNCKLIKTFLKGEGDAESLPPLYKAVHAYVSANWGELQNDKSFVASLKGERDKNPVDDKLGHRLPLPLHHRQELALADPFIDLETNRLRQAAWGLSEMKISAGYLRRADVKVIGGLEADVGKLPLIVPMGIPRIEEGENQELSYKDLCLAYRFWVKLPKDVLIVADNTQKWAAFKSDTIGVVSYAEVMGNAEKKTKGDIGLMSDYGFILVDHDKSLGDGKLKLPFRALEMVGGTQKPKTGLACVPKAPLENAETSQEFVECVYRAWLEHLKERRFKARDVLIVADDPSRWEKALCWKETDVKPYGEVIKDGEGADHLARMSRYGFVVIDHADEIGPAEQAKFPFRTLRLGDARSQQDGAVRVPRETLEGAESGPDFVGRVNLAWLNYYKARSLSVKLKIYEKKGGEKGLISDRDVYRILFRECLHSILEPIAVADDGRFDALQRKALLLISLYPLDENDDLFRIVPEKLKGSHQRVMGILLGRIAGKVRKHLEDRRNSGCGKVLRIEEIYRQALAGAKDTMEEAQGILDDLVGIFEGCPRDSGEREVLNELAAMSENPSGSDIIRQAAEALVVARTTSDVFLRKYEERIATLPRQYKGEATTNTEPPDFGRLGVDIVFDGQADISYNRHATDNASLYSEPLSGSQTYLNALSNLSSKDAQWAMRLAENGLLRMAIIDERVRAFVADHGEDIRKTYESMHIAVVETQEPPRFDAEQATFPEWSDWKWIARNPADADFDLVVIHQGIIDKWWPVHDKYSVEEILNKLRRPQGVSDGSEHDRFVVVTTGRGRPDNIPDHEKVLAFSSIEAFLFKRYPEKLNLVNSLMSILPGSPERNDGND